MSQQDLIAMEQNLHDKYGIAQAMADDAGDDDDGLEPIDLSDYL